MPTFEELARQASDSLRESGQEGEESQGSSSFDFRTAMRTGAQFARPLDTSDIDRYAQLYEQTMNFRNMWSGGDFERYRYNYERVTLRLSDMWGAQTREERTTGMHVSIKPPELTAEKRQLLTDFYSVVLYQGFGNWPLHEREAVLWVDGRARVIKTYSEWCLTEEYLYIGYSSDRGQERMSDPVLRLATITALMAMTGHTGNPTLMGLVEQRLSAILAGNYQAAVAALGQRPNGSPVEQIAWSTAHGLAARLGDEWVRPLTGEPVEVGAGWVVLEVPKQQAVAVGGEAEVSQDPQTAVRTLREFAQDRDYMTRWLGDGRLAIRFGDESRANNVYQAAIDFGCQNLVVELINGSWCVTTISQTETSSPTPF